MKKDVLADGTPRFKILKPPFRDEKTRIGLFLGGSIEMGKAEDWQAKITEQIKFMNVEIYNPRRDDWDSTWKQSIDSPAFNGQVTWELDHLERADVILMYFDPNTMAPISLMELGLFAKDFTKKMVVYCPEGYFRKGNVDIVCQRYRIPVISDETKLLGALIDAINQVPIGGK